MPDRAPLGPPVTAIVLNNPTYLPSDYDDMIEAWDRLGEEWQGYVRLIKQHYMHLIEAD